jgi:hypothetical protein
MSTAPKPVVRSTAPEPAAPLVDIAHFEPKDVPYLSGSGGLWIPSIWVPATGTSAIRVRVFSKALGGRFDGDFDARCGAVWVLTTLWHLAGSHRIGRQTLLHIRQRQACVWNPEHRNPAHCR